VRVDDGGWLVERVKLVRPDFTAGNVHWSRGPLERNPVVGTARTRRTAADEAGRRGRCGLFHARRRSERCTSGDALCPIASFDRAARGHDASRLRLRASPCRAVLRRVTLGAFGGGFETEAAFASKSRDSLPKAGSELRHPSGLPKTSKTNVCFASSSTILICV
jgi:hypothetical protein